MKKLNLKELDDLEPSPVVERIVKKSKRNPKKDAKRTKRSKRKISYRDLYN